MLKLPVLLAPQLAGPTAWVRLTRLVGEQRARDDPLKGPLGSSAQPWAAVADPTCTSTSTFTTPLETGIAARPCRLLELPRYLSPQVGIALQLGPDFLLAPAGLVSDKGGLRPGRVLEEVLGTALTPDAQWLRDRREKLAASAPLAIRAPVFAIFAASLFGLPYRWLNYKM